MSWNGSDTLSYTFDGTPITTWTGDLSTSFLAGSDFANYGFTAATGGLSNLQMVRATGIEATLDTGDVVNIQSVAENTTFVETLTSPDPATFTITGGDDAALFDIVGSNLVFKTAPDYETDPHSYQVEVSAFDGVNTTAKTITVNVTDVNDNAPVIITNATQSVAESTTFNEGNAATTSLRH